MTNFAWTPGQGAYKHYPPFVNLTGNRLTVRGIENLSGPHPAPGETVSVEVPDEQLATLAIAITARSGETK